MTSEDKVFLRVRTLITGMIEERRLQQKDVNVANMTLQRALKRGNITLRSLVKITHELGFELVLNVRQR